MIEMLTSINRQYDYFLNDLKQRKKISIGTLGPAGTSSEQALKYLITNIRKHTDETEFEIILKNNFSQIFDDLEKGFISYALIPSAYERITDFFWNNNFENNLNFIFTTPEYGIVCREGQLIDPSRKLKIACCSPVQNIIGSLSNGELKEHNVIKILTSSTTEALLCLLNGMADLAITNQTSFDLYKDRGIQFVYKKYSARIVWSLFKQKELLEVHY